MQAAGLQEQLLFQARKDRQITNCQFSTIMVISSNFVFYIINNVLGEKVRSNFPYHMQISTKRNKLLGGT
jgi:hypothetical protein